MNHNYLDHRIKNDGQVFADKDTHEMTALELALYQARQKQIHSKNNKK